MHKYKCKKCKKLFSTNQALRRHNNRKYPCDNKNICLKCGLEFDTKQHLTEHMNIKNNCVIRKINKINEQKNILIDNYVDYNTLYDKIIDLIELISKLEELNIKQIEELLNFIKNKEDNIESKIIIKLLSNKIKINEITILKKIDKINTMKKYCDDYLLEISNISTKIKYNETKEYLEQINYLGFKKLPILNYQQWKNYKQYLTFFCEQDDVLLSFKSNNDMILIKNNFKIFKFNLNNIIINNIQYE